MTELDYSNDDLVYIDPAKKLIVGKVEFSKNGNPIKKEMVFEEQVDSDEEASGSKKGPRKRRGKGRKRYYPWGTFKSARKLYNIGGKYREEDKVRPFEDALQLALAQAYWDDPVDENAPVKEKEADSY